VVLGTVCVYVSLAGAAGDFDVCAIHVHLAVCYFVEPCPRECVCPRTNALRNRVVVGIGTVS